MTVERCSHTFWKWLSSTWSLWQDFLTFWDSLASEADTLLSIKDRTLPDERLDTTRATVDLVKGDLADDLRSVVPSQMSAFRFVIVMNFHGLAKLLNLLDLLWELLGEAFLKGLRYVRSACLSQCGHKW